MIYIVRHGQTDYNVEGRYGGRIDIDINEKGRQQAYQIKEKLKDIKFDIVFSSPLKRAYETAQIICDNNIIKDKRIIVRDNGSLKGKLKSEAKEEINFNNLNEKRYNIESIIDFRNRINNFLEYVSKNCKGKNVLIVTHACVGICISCYFEGEPKNNDYSIYKLKNCEVLEYNNECKN